MLDEINKLKETINNQNFWGARVDLFSDMRQPSTDANYQIEVLRRTVEKMLNLLIKMREKNENTVAV